MDLETVATTLVTGLSFGVILFLLFVWSLARKLQNQIDQELDHTMEKLVQEQLIALTVEVDNNQYFCYNALTKAFVCQGHDLKEIIERFRLRYPNKAAAIYDGDEIAVKTLKKQMKELGDNFSSIGRES
jgi:thioredoxin-related protein